MRICELAIERGVFAQAIRPPTVPEGTSRLRLAVMASHTKAELREAAQVLGRAALQAGWRPGEGVPVAAAREAAAAPRTAVRHRAPGRVGALALCAASSSPAPTRASARPCSPRRWPRRCAPTASTSPRSSPRSPALDEPEADRPADHELLAAAAGRPADEVTPHRFGPAVSPHLAAELAGTALDPAALVAARARPARRRRRRRGRRRAARPAHPRLHDPRPRGRPRLAGRGGRAARASGRSTTRCSRWSRRARRGSTCARSC